MIPWYRASYQEDCTSVAGSVCKVSRSSLSKETRLLWPLDVELTWHTSAMSSVQMGFSRANAAPCRGSVSRAMVEYGFQELHCC